MVRLASPKLKTACMAIKRTPSRMSVQRRSELQRTETNSTTGLLLFFAKHISAKVHAKGAQAQFEATAPCMKSP